MFINQNSGNKKLIHNVLEIADKAKEHKKKDPDVINACIGMLYNDDLEFYQFEEVNNIINNLTIEEKYGYSNTSASLHFESSLCNHLFKKHLDTIKKSNFIKIALTPGGTGALSNVFSNYLEKDSTVLLSDINWSNYQSICKEYQVKCESHDYFDQNNHFNRSDFMEKINFIIKTQKKIVYILNDPCHNPTGFSLTKEDYLFIVYTFNNLEKEGVNCVLVYDIAYLDFSNDEFFINRDVFNVFNDLKQNSIVLICFSGSKTYSVYGLRLGALIILSKNLEEAKAFVNCNDYSSRTKWSNITSIGINLVEKINGNQKFEQELKIAREIVKNRSDLFINLLNEHDIKHYNYKDGFFVTLKYEQPLVLFEKLEKLKVYTVPLKKGVRIALSCLSYDEIPKLVARIKEAYNK